MPRHIAFFSSINVGGNRVSMADLRWAMEREGFADIETVVASGNVLCDFAARPSEGIEELLGHMMAERFDIASFAAVRSRDELAAVIAADPFGDADEARAHVMFLSRQPDAAQFAQAASDYAGRGRERIAPGERALYVDFADGVAGSRLTSAFIERRLGCQGTMRNRRSLKRILAKLDAGEGG